MIFSIMSLQGRKQSHGEKRICKVRDCFVPRNDIVDTWRIAEQYIYTLRIALLIGDCHASLAITRGENAGLLTIDLKLKFKLLRLVLGVSYQADTREKE